jgi:hypothetical protein
MTRADAAIQFKLRALSDQLAAHRLRSVDAELMVATLGNVRQLGRNS